MYNDVLSFEHRRCFIVEIDTNRWGGFQRGSLLKFLCLNLQQLPSVDFETLTRFRGFFRGIRWFRHQLMIHSSSRGGFLCCWLAHRLHCNVRNKLRAGRRVFLVGGEITYRLAEIAVLRGKFICRTDSVNFSRRIANRTGGGSLVVTQNWFFQIIQTKTRRKSRLVVGFLKRWKILLKWNMETQQAGQIKLVAKTQQKQTTFASQIYNQFLLFRGNKKDIPVLTSNNSFSQL